ncbi:unnamed protein product [Rotaria socialis]|uniref:Uncharacterized protein n=1 Tax=Rotaria socialis TaxID=392032 RepID=A0A821W6P1_9BILA|nr:unnamed protein product [Rotaria socialis]CAF3729875.1 unnamed protein product [Rotaria socialis]CAF3793557.1 unnamed protein product [Rotaria socialis]CAF4612497.1 unnamed protein product [Rotaria socialis]CAF4847741.1 unnamed protein product [Rotaria socialis]
MRSPSSWMMTWVMLSIISYFFIEHQFVSIGALTISTYGLFSTTIKAITTNMFLGDRGGFPEHTLNVPDCILQLDLNQSILYSKLRHLDSMVHEEKFLHALCSRLLNLETLNIFLVTNDLEIEDDSLLTGKFVSLEIITEQDIDDGVHYSYLKCKAKEEVDHIMVVALPHLRSASIKGHITTFGRLNPLFQLTSASLDSINLNIKLLAIVDPNQINAIPAHIRFNYWIAYDIELPADFNWSTYIDTFTQRPAL